MKALKPSHREHKRYLLISGKDASEKNINESILKFVGILGYAKASAQVIRLEKPKEGKIVISVNRKELDKVKASLLLSGKDIRIENISGVLNKL